MLPFSASTYNPVSFFNTVHFNLSLASFAECIANVSTVFACISVVSILIFSASNYTLNFTIPQGPTGPQGVAGTEGATGPTGPTGPTGASA